MKLKNLYLKFNLIQKVYDNCSYERVFELLESYKELENKIGKICIINKLIKL